MIHAHRKIYFPYANVSANVYLICDVKLLVVYVVIISVRLENIDDFFQVHLHTVADCLRMQRKISLKVCAIMRTFQTTITSKFNLK